MGKVTFIEISDGEDIEQEMETLGDNILPANHSHFGCTKTKGQPLKS